MAVGSGETKRPPPSVYPFKLARRKETRGTTNPDGTERRPKVVNFGLPLLPSTCPHSRYATESQNARSLRTFTDLPLPGGGAGEEREGVYFR